MTLLLTIATIYRYCSKVNYIVKMRRSNEMKVNIILTIIINTQHFNMPLQYARDAQIQ